MNFFEEKEREPLPQVLIGEIEITRGSRVRLRPRPGGDVLDLALAGRVAVVESIEQDFDDNVQVAVTVEDDPGRDLGQERQPGHRFYFSILELEPIAAEPEEGR